MEIPSRSQNFCWQVAKWAYLNYTVPVCFILSSNGAIAKQWRDWREKGKDRFGEVEKSISMFLALIFPVLLSHLVLNIKILIKNSCRK